MSSATASSPETFDDLSRGSSVSAGLQQEYEELLKYAVVTPKVDLPENIYLRGHGSQSAFKVRINAEEKSEDSSSANGSKESSLASSEGLKEVSQIARDVVRQLPPYEDSSHSQLRLQNEERFRMDGRAEASSPQLNVMIPSHPPENYADSPASTESHQTLLSDTSPVTDVDLVRMETLMDEWCLDLKRNVLAEFSTSKMRLLERYKEQLARDRERHSVEVFNLQTEIENLKEVLHTFEKSVTQKDLVIQNMTGAMQKQRQKYEQLQTFAVWRLQHNDDKREKFASKLATKHYDRTLASRAMSGWRGVVESKWKHRVEKACQARAQEVCVQLTEDYEERLQGLQRQLDEARTEVAAMHKERDSYEETMKKAFMRGVCALNMEAMTMFRENKVDPQDSTSARSAAPSIAARPIPSAPHGPFVDGNNVGLTSSVTDNQPMSQTTVNQSRKFPITKTLHVKANARGDPGKKRSAGSTHPSTVSSVLVERHTSSNENIPGSIKTDKNLLPGQTKTKSVRFEQSATSSQRFSKSNNLPRVPNIKVVE